MFPTTTTGRRPMRSLIYPHGSAVMHCAVELTAAKVPVRRLHQDEEP